MTTEHLGSTAMKQMIYEAKHLTQISFLSSDYPRIYLVYDPAFSLHILHNGWNAVPLTLQALFRHVDPQKRPEYGDKNYFITCLSWLMDIPYTLFERIMIDANFILTENFTYKLFHVHERKLTKLALIIEGETGVGKTFLLKFYSLLLNANVANSKLEDNPAPKILERTSRWLLTHIIREIRQSEPNLLNLFLQEIQPELLGFENTGEDDPTNHRLLSGIEKSLLISDYKHGILQYIWATFIGIAHENANDVAKKLLVELHEFVISFLSEYPLI
ncbi:unnamed protein product, partial [Rotaria socialis]